MSGSVDTIHRLVRAGVLGKISCDPLPEIRQEDSNEEAA